MYSLSISQYIFIKQQTHSTCIAFSYVDNRPWMLKMSEMRSYAMLGALNMVKISWLMHDTCLKTKMTNADMQKL